MNNNKKPINSKPILEATINEYNIAVMTPPHSSKVGDLKLMK